MYHALDQELDARVFAVRDFLARQPADASSGQLRLALGAVSVLGPVADLYQVIDERGNWLHRAGLLEGSGVPIPSVAQLAAGRIKEDQVVGGVRLRFRAKRVEANGKLYGVQVAEPVRNLDEGLRRFQMALLLFGPLALLISCGGGWWLSRGALRPVGEIISAARAISEANLSQRLPEPKSRDELYRLSATLNEMLGRIEGSFQRIKQFTADASHELRTPIGLILASADWGLRRPRDAAEYRQALAEIKDEALGMTQLLENMMELARADANQAGLDPRPTDLALLSGEVCRKVEPLAAAKGLTFDLAFPTEACVATVDPMAVRRLLLILLDNAIKYTGSGGRVSLQLARFPDRVDIAVEDNGIGIPPEDLPRLFDRFYRSEKSRSRDFGGVGLGLALAKWIVSSHSGTITVESEVNRGSRFLVRIPQIRPA
jgi:heavy metal sensor kinase